LREQQESSSQTFCTVTLTM